MTLVRQVATNSVHLTFDDGPIPKATDRVLAVLEKHQAKATFFVVVERARKERALLQRIRQAGHAIGNHSLDHRFGNFFRSDAVLREWVRRADEELQQMLGEAPVGFRSPAGVRTPPLARVLRELEIPWVHWNMRFFDTVFPWTERRAKAAALRVRPGSIVLLHDEHASAEALEQFLQRLAERGVPAEALTRALVSADSAKL